MRLLKKENIDAVDIELTRKMIEYTYQNRIYSDTAYPYHNRQMYLLPVFFIILLFCVILRKKQK